MSTMLSQVEEEVHCFVCDMLVTGRYYSLATCRTQSSKTRIIEKLGALVGDQYMVVISEDDVICRSCATYMNTLDRLETEALSIRGTVLKYLEKKYQLSEGELVNQKNTGLSQPPRIMPSEKALPVEKKGFANRGSFMARKRKAALAQMSEIDEQENVMHKRNSKSPWMQCNTCKYTTSYDNFMHHHINDEITDDIVIDPIVPIGKVIKVGAGKAPGTKKATHKSSAAELLARAISGQDSSHESDAETVEMIAAEINDYGLEHAEDGIPMDSKTDLKVEPGTIKVQIVSQGKSRKKFYGNNDKEVTIQLPSLPGDDVAEDMPLITSDVDHTAGMSIEEQMLKMNESDENTVYVHMMDSDKTAEVAGSAKQVMTVSDDGTVEMVEVLWDEEGHGEAAEDGTEY